MQQQEQVQLRHQSQQQLSQHQHRQRGEPPVVDEALECGEPDEPPADVLVPIHAAATRLLGVIAVDRLQAVEADQRTDDEVPTH